MGTGPQPLPHPSPRWLQPFPTGGGAGPLRMGIRTPDAAPSWPANLLSGTGKASNNPGLCENYKTEML